MQVSISQCHFLHLIIKTSKIKKILEIGTFTGLSSLTMSLALPNNGKLISLDKNVKTSEVAGKFFKKAKQENKIKVLIGSRQTGSVRLAPYFRKNGVSLVSEAISFKKV